MMEKPKQPLSNGSIFFYSRSKEIFFIVKKLYKNQENIRSTTLYFIDPENKNIFVVKKN